MRDKRVGGDEGRGKKVGISFLSTAMNAQYDH